MAKYRPIQIRIWKDPDFEKYNANMKLIFLYLCTNELTTESGIYAISTRTISQETHIPESNVNKLLANGLKNIDYDFDNSCVFVKNFLKYNGGGSPELVKKSIANNYEEFKTSLWNEFIKLYPKFSNGLQTVNKPFISISNRIRIRNSIKEGDIKGDKIKYGEFVLLSKEEYQKLIEQFGKELADDKITDLNLGIGSKGYKYKDHYLTILSWDRREKKKKKEEQDKKPKYKELPAVVPEEEFKRGEIPQKVKDQIKRLKLESLGSQVKK